jgi:hypothetical protein
MDNQPTNVYRSLLKGYDNMTSKVFDLARQAMATLEWYRGFYGSAPPFPERFTEVLNMLRRTAENQSSAEGEKKLLLAFADALEIANKPGEYRPLNER